MAVPDLKAATDRLTTRVEELNHSITISTEQARRNRRLLRYVVVALVVMVVAIGVMAGAAIQAHRAASSAKHATEANKASQVTNCQNSNDSRQATLVLWQFIFDQSKGANPKQEVALQKIETWIGQLYAPHDCSDLSKKYPIPPAPKVSLG